MSTTEQRGESTVDWAELPTLNLSLESTHSCLTLWTNDGLRPLPGLLPWRPSEVSMQQSPVAKLAGSQLTGLKVGGCSGYELESF